MSYIKKIKNEKFFILLIILVSISLLIGFHLNEDSTGGAYLDYSVHNQISEKFLANFEKTLFEYDQLKSRHSPVIPIFFSFFKYLEINEYFVRLFNLIIPFLIVYIFYKCLRLNFKKINSIILILFSFLIILSPTVRSLSIWPDSHLFGLLFFVLTLYSFLIFLQSEKNKKIYYAIMNIILLALCCYIRPSFVLFSIYFFWFFYKEYRFSKNLFFLFFLNILLSLPAFYFLFILDVMFLTIPAVNGIDLFTKINPSNKILIISSIIFFHAMPFIYYKFSLIKEKFNNLNTYEHIFLILFILINIYFFNYKLNFTGGGIFLHFSNIFNSNIIFFLICYFSFIFIYLISMLDIKNFILLIIIFLSNPQLTIYHKYYDPMVLITFFLLFNLNLDDELNKKKYVLFFYIHSLFFLLLSLVK